MKTQQRWLIAFVAVISTPTLCLGAADDTAPKGFGALVGYRGFDLNGSDFSYAHNTHPGDGFLPNSAVPGSAGTTSVEKFANFGVLGIRYQNFLNPKKETLSYNVDFGGLFGGARDEMQNANDNRPAANGAFVYSKARWGFFAGVGMDYHFQGKIKGLYTGASVNINGILVSHGFDRFGQDQSAESSLKWIPSFGPRIGYQFSSKMFTELSLQFGKSPGIGFNIGSYF